VKTKALNTCRLAKARTWNAYGDIAGMSTHADLLGRRALVIAFIINLVMMSVDLWYGLMMNSASLLGDAANNSGDVFILGSSILVLSSTPEVKNRLALFKGIIMTVFGLWAFYHVYLGLMGESDLTGGIISLIGVMSLAGNSAVAFMMYKHQHKDINFLSAFICCRNDAIASAGIILAGLLVMFTGSFWPDVVIGTAIAIIVCHGGIRIIRLSLDPAATAKDACCADDDCC
jgi:Co/Zn/Cd efflux system component